MDIRCGRCKISKSAEEFAPSQTKNGQWCRSCFHESYREQRPAPPPRPCEVCGEQMQEPKPRQRFCSTYCKNQNRLRAYTAAWHAEMATRTCDQCGASLLGKHRHARFCSPRCSDAFNNAARTDPTLRRSQMLKSKYGLTLDDFNALFAEQGGRCAICGTDEPNAQHGQWQIDHCHDSGKVRGLLCGPCNTGIGQMKDDPARLRAAADYLDRH